jgi:hypothetical protein
MQDDTEDRHDEDVAGRFLLSRGSVSHGRLVRFSGVAENRRRENETNLERSQLEEGLVSEAIPSRSKSKTR